MEVQVISNTIQRFNGESFYLCGFYYQRKGKRLHRAVWEYYHGEIPEGFHIHHKDGDRSNNNISNLVLLEGSDHLSGHMSKEERKAKSRENIEKARVSASEWHRSKNGKEWHSERGKANWRLRTTQSYICTHCGKEFQTKYIYSANSNHFCHPNCKAAYRRARVKRGEIPQ
jgi:DNA-directed RNA polymerase subunit RPC12/RpoP